MRHNRLLAFAGLAAVTVAAEAHAAGFYLQEQGVRGTGRAYSGEVADQGVESLWWNPAAIARSGRELYVGANGLSVQGTVSDRGSTVTNPFAATAPVGGEPRAFNPVTTGLLPNIAVALPLNDRFAVGVSLAAPFNFTSQYDARAWTRYDALTSSLRTADLQLTGAMRVTDWLDVGAAADVTYAKARLSNALPNFFAGSPDALQQLEGDGWKAGWSAGAQAYLGRLTLGASYRSKIDHKLSGTVSFKNLLPPFPSALNASQPGRATYATPWIAAVGGRFALTDRLTIDAQAQRMGWSAFKAIDVTTPLGSQVIQEQYRDTTSGAVGLDYALDPRLTLRAGVQYDPTPTRDGIRSARVPDGDRLLFGVGATASPTPRLKLDAAFLYIKFKDTRIDDTVSFFEGTPAASSSHLVGDVSAAGYVLSLGMRTSF